jgi:outer membrane protein assembly factor BamB
MPALRSFSVLLLMSGSVVAADWPQWLGPKRDASTTEKVAPWKGPLKVLWRTAVGEGHSSPVVADGRVYLHTKVAGKEEEAVTAYDAESGEQLWQKTYVRPAYKGLFGNGPRATPTVARGLVFTHGITGVLTCLDAYAGKQLWQVDTLKEFKAPKLFFGSSCSPLIAGGFVLVNVGAPGASIVAFHPAGGKIVWKKLDDKASYASPIIVGKDANTQVIFLTAKGVVSLAPADGALFWRVPMVDLLAESSSTPVAAGDILLASSITTGSIGIRLENKDSKPAATKVWTNPDLTCYFSTPLAVGKDHVYLVTGTKPPALVSESTLRCIERETGKELWRKKGVGTFHASLLRTGDSKLLMLEEKGDLVLLDPDPEGYRELARARICGKTWAHPALSNGRLFIRDDKELVCVQLAP